MSNPDLALSGNLSRRRKVESLGSGGKGNWSLLSHATVTVSPPKLGEGNVHFWFGQREEERSHSPMADVAESAQLKILKNSCCSPKGLGSCGVLLFVIVCQFPASSPCLPPERRSPQ